jgi:hypothetical protein
MALHRVEVLLALGSDDADPDFQEDPGDEPFTQIDVHIRSESGAAGLRREFVVEIVCASTRRRDQDRPTRRHNPDERRGRVD